MLLLAAVLYISSCSFRLISKGEKKKNIKTGGACKQEHKDRGRRSPQLEIEVSPKLVKLFLVYCHHQKEEDC